MASYRVFIKPSAGKELATVGSKSDRVRIVSKIQQLATDPRRHGTTKLAGYEDRYRVRQGSYRIVYLVDDSQHEVTIFKTGDRKDIYR